MPRLRAGLSVFIRSLQREWRFVIATAAASGVGYLGAIAAPVLVQALIESGLNYQQAGNLGTIELLMLATSSMLIAPYAPTVSHRKLAIGGGLLAAVGLLVSAQSTSMFEMLIGRVITGIGSGFAISGANAAVAAREDAERIFAIIWTLGGVVTAAVVRYMPEYVKDGNYPLGFSILVVLCLVGVPLMAWIPQRPASFGSVPVVRTSATGVPDSEPAESRTVFGPMTLMALFGMLIYSAAELALWQFAYNIPVESGIAEETASKALAFATLMGLVGGAIAALLGVRLGRIAPLLVGSLCSVIGRGVYIAASSSEWLFLGALLWGLGFYFVAPYQLGLVAAIDRRGRVAVAGGAALNFGYAIGPAIAGWILQRMDHSALIVAICGATLLSMFLLLPLAIRVERGLASEPAASVERAQR